MLPEKGNILESNHDEKKVAPGDPDESFDDQVVLHNQETFEDHINNLEQVLDHKTPTLSKWERPDEDSTKEEEESGTNKEDRDLRELLKAKSSLSSSNLTSSLRSSSVVGKNTPSLEMGTAHCGHEPDYEKLIEEKLNDDDRIDLLDETLEGSGGDKDVQKKTSKEKENSDSEEAEEKGPKKKKKKLKEKKHKHGKKEKKKNEKMLKKIFGEDGLQKLLSKIDEGENPEEIWAQAVLAKAGGREGNWSKSTSPQHRDKDLRSYEKQERSQDRESKSRRAVMSDGNSLKIAINSRNSPKRERGKDSIRRRSHDRSIGHRSHQRSPSKSTSPSPVREMSSRKNDRTGSKMQSESRLTSDGGFQKKLSIKERLGPITKGSSGGSDRTTERSVRNKSRSSPRKKEWNGGSSDEKHGKRDRSDKDRDSPPPKKRSRDASVDDRDSSSRRERSKSPISVKDRRSTREERNREKEKTKQNNGESGAGEESDNDSLRNRNRTNPRLERYRSRIDTE